MNPATIELSWLDIALSAGLVAAAGAVSVALRLGLTGRLAVAALRTVVQLVIVGYVLHWVFARSNVAIVLALAALMIGVASHAALKRAGSRYRGAGLDIYLVLITSAMLTAFIVTAAVIQVRPWYEPRYFIPLLGMILGNSLTGISLCLDHLLGQFRTQRGQVEMELAHGATRWEAARPVVREAVRRGMIPIINSMSVVGLVSLPGMMTGQILAGNPPMQAVQYQIVVMFMIAAATAMSCIGAALFGYLRLFNRRHQLLAQRIEKHEA